MNSWTRTAAAMGSGRGTRQQQLNIAQGVAHSVKAGVREEQQAISHSSYCAALSFERQQIWKRAGAGTGYVAPQQLGPARTRWKQIEAEMAWYNCPR